jgi:PPK2 family polyphosphate:nucleotide phosphotransferase
MGQMKNTKKLSDFIKKYQIDDGKKFRLKDYDPGDTHGLDADSKGVAKELLQQGIDKLEVLQDKLYAQDKWAVLLIFQAMDAAGKDSTIKHVMSGVNPQGCQVFSFKTPSAEELDHDFLWRTTRCLPERGRIGIFNRSYYEEALVVRVHPEYLKPQRLPEELITKKIWDERFESIRCFEEHLARNGTVVRKFFLHVSKQEQKKRFLSRLDQPEKNWKFSAADVKERQCWDDYQKAYEEVIRETSTEACPWFVVPADHKWFARLVVAGAVVDALKGLKLEYPTLDPQKKAELDQARKLLMSESKSKS